MRDHPLKQNRNTRHASLFQCGFSVKMIPVFEKVLKTNPRFIDMNFFKCVSNYILFEDEKIAVGIKGQSGRPGIGAGHAVTREVFKLDIPHYELFKNLIGLDCLNYF